MICYIIYYVHRIDQKVSLYVKCGAGVGVKREFVPASLPELEVGDTKIIGGKSCEAIKINF